MTRHQKTHEGHEVSKNATEMNWLEQFSLPDAGLSELFGRILPIDGTAGDTLRSQSNA